MNELIKEFEKQATTIEYGVDNGFDRVTFDKEKFAELIVRECLSYAKDGDLDFMKFMIKKNFGVEE